MKWLARYTDLEAYLAAHGGEYPTQRDPSGLGAWINIQRQAYRRPQGDTRRLSEDRIELLERLPWWDWGASRVDIWPSRLEALKTYMDGHDGAYPAQRDPTGLGTWVNAQRAAYRRPEGHPQRLSADRIQELERLPGWTWNAKVETWRSRFEALRVYLEAHNGLYPTHKDNEAERQLVKWINNQRIAYRRAGRAPRRLSAEQIGLLEGLPGWAWQGRFNQSKKNPSRPSKRRRTAVRGDEVCRDDDHDDD